MDLAENQAEARPCGALLKRREGQIQAARIILESPGLHQRVGAIAELHRAELMDAPVQDDRVLRGPPQVAKAAAEVQPDRAAAGQKARGAGPVPEAAVRPD